jgi:hypothetical protein
VGANSPHPLYLTKVKKAITGSGYQKKIGNFYTLIYTTSKNAQLKTMCNKNALNKSQLNSKLSNSKLSNSKECAAAFQ